ncbi:hypothetical protein [Macrococcus capreoli]|uniref:hypothetical protein n=1 Tax=Macrococcus capreoli TaxID=2982690 RepID=UPI0021D56EB9|nr:hypothetical protein [Macrococcus sp. TMW 2.2395]MCU7558633.1 hypothetical protein [Macrococcus sp. TMW 2.2395]
MNHIMRMEYNGSNIMILSVEINSIISAVILYEDLNRPGELKKDFSFLIPKYYSEDDVLDDIRNLISIKVFSLMKKEDTDRYKEDISFIAESFIEDRQTMNIKLEWIEDKKIEKYYINGDRKLFINQLLRYCEGQHSISIKRFDHLTQ